MFIFPTWANNANIIIETLIVFIRETTDLIFSVWFLPALVSAIATFGLYNLIKKATGI